MEPDIHVDFDTLHRFTASVEDDVTRSLRPGARRCLPPIEGAADAIGTNGRFDEAVLVRRQGDVTTASARDFLDLLGEHVASMATDVKRARRQYEETDMHVAERTNIERERVWKSTHAAPGMPSRIFVQDESGDNERGPMGGGHAR